MPTVEAPSPLRIVDLEHKSYVQLKDGKVIVAVSLCRDMFDAIPVDELFCEGLEFSFKVIFGDTHDTHFRFYPGN